MKTVAVMSQKGGAGKTTLSVHLAVTAWQQLTQAHSGLAPDAVRLVDTDPQTSASMWSKHRKESAPLVESVSVRHLKASLDAARAGGSVLTIIDTAPNAGPDAVDVAKLADLVVIPVRPSMFDLAAAKRTIDIVKEAGTPALIVLSACPLRAPEIGMAREALGMSGLPVAETEIGDRRPFARAIQTGKAVCEFDAGSKADQEIRDLLQEVWR